MSKNNPFDNKVIIIDEAHRLVNSISNQNKKVKGGTKKPVQLAIQIYNKPLTPNEITQNFNVMKSRFNLT